MVTTEEELNKNSTGSGSDKKNKNPKVADWRYGPAQLWYDMLGVDDSGQDFDYGFKLKQVITIVEERHIMKVLCFHASNCNISSYLFIYYYI